MTDRQDKQNHTAPDEGFLYDDAGFPDEEMVEGEEEIEAERPRAARTRNPKMDMRHRIEERLEQRRLLKELNEYEYFDLDDEGALH